MERRHATFRFHLLSVQIIISRLFIIDKTVRGLDTNARLTILSSKDIIIAIFFIVLGILAIMLGFGIHESIELS